MSDTATSPPSRSAAPGTPPAVRWLARAVWVLLAVATAVLGWHVFLHDTSGGLDAQAYAARVCERWEPAGSAMAAAWEEPGAGTEPQATALALRRSADAASRLGRELAAAGRPQGVAGADQAVLDARRDLDESVEVLRDASTAAVADPDAAVAAARPHLDLPLVDGDGPGDLGAAFADDERCGPVLARLAVPTG